MTMIVTTTVGMNAQLKLKVPGVNSLTACPVGAMTPAVLGPMPLLTVPAVGTSGNGVTQVSVDPTGTVSGVTGNTLVVSVDVPLTTWSGRPIGVVVAT
jgi:hypothetical protein